MKDKNLARAGAFLKAELVAKGYSWTEGKYAGEWSAEKTLRAIESIGGRVHKPSLYAYLGGAARISRKVLPYILKVAGVTVDQYVAMGGRDTSPEGRQKFKRAQLDRGIPLPVRKPRSPGEAKPARVTLRDLNCTTRDLVQELHAMIQDQREAFQAINDKLDKFLATPAPSYAPVFEKQLTTDLTEHLLAAVDKALEDNHYDPIPETGDVLSLTPRMVAAREKARKEVADFLNTTPEDLERFPETSEVQDA